MSDPIVSVIIPVYNTMPYLTACLDSLVAQTIGLDRLQVVAVDDGSNDGSELELDSYAARYPGSFVVVHQANSGGPAQPCNRGLELATGRYVFFLGADDYLGVEALERLVKAAEEWHSDVVIGVMAGVNGRFVDQRLFAQHESDVDFQRFPLAYSLSNTKLFRRSLIDEHRIRYALDLRVGSDQPFVVEAMTHARRISVVAGYTCYYAVRREDAANITYATQWGVRLGDVAAIMRHIADVVPPGPTRDAILRRHFQWELDKLIRLDFPALDEVDQRRLASGIAALADDYLTDGVSAYLTVPARVRLRLAQRGDLETLHRVLAYTKDKPPMVKALRPDHVYQWLPAFGEPETIEDWYELDDDAPKGLVIHSAEISRHQLVLRGQIGVTADSSDHLRLVLQPLSADEPTPPGGRHPRGCGAEVTANGLPVQLSQPVVGGPSQLWAGVDLRRLPVAEPDVRWSLRLQTDVGRWTYDTPVQLPGVDLDHVVHHGLRRAAVQVVSERQSRLVVHRLVIPLAAEPPSKAEPQPIGTF